MHFFESTAKRIVPSAGRVLTNTTDIDNLESSLSLAHWKVALVMLIPVTSAVIFMYYTSWPWDTCKPANENKQTDYQPLASDDQRTVEISSSIL